METGNMTETSRRRLVNGLGVAGVAVAIGPSLSAAQTTTSSPATPSASRAGGSTVPQIKGVHHVGVRTFDMAASKRFWCDVLGFVAHPEKDNWLGVEGSDHRFIHLMPALGASTSSARSSEDARDMANHVALEVADLKVVVVRLLEFGLKPFQAGLDPSERRDLASSEVLNFGIGTVFVIDPSGNVVEFMQRDFGIFALIKG